MNLSELIHRPAAEDSSSVVHSNYEQFQPATDAMQLYNNVEVLEPRFVTGKSNDEGIYSPQKLLPMSSPTTSSSSWHYNPTAAESSRSPYASTLSDQSDRPRLPLPDSPPSAPTAAAALISRGGGATPASTDSPASPIPMDRLASPNHFSESPEFHEDNNTIANLYARKASQMLNITGSSVTKDNIEEGYVQFVLHHDPQSINDSIESLMYVKRKFSSVPKTGDLSYTTWDVFTLVKKLHNQQIKNWSQLVGQLGLADMTGRPQFAQRVKRWMRKYRIDCYFDYLLGNPYSFHSPDEKYSGCLMMGNYQKRKSGKAQAVATDETDSVKSSGSGSRTRKRSRYYMLTDEEDEEEDDEQHGSSDDEQRTPIVLAGSRKRSRISPHQHVSTESMRLSKALQESHRSSEENDNDDDDNNNNNNNNNNNEEEGDEEDELASTSSSSTVSRNINRSTPNHDLIPSHPQPQQTSTAGPSSSPLPCADCIQVQQTVSSLQQDISQLKEHIAALQGKLDQEVQSKQDMAKQLSRLESICLHYDHWRTKLAENLLQNPLTTDILDRKPNSTFPSHKS